MKLLVKGLFPNFFNKFFQRMCRSYSSDDFINDSCPSYEADVLKCRIAYNKFGGYCVPLSSQHRPAAQKILSNDVHEPKTISYMLSRCGDGDIVHAGTYFGDFLPALSKSVASGAKIWAFEPNLENYRCANITLALNAIENTVLRNAGLGEKHDMLHVKTKDTNGHALGGASQIVANKVIEEVGVESVQILTIDDVVESDRDVSIIQLDVEGHEKEALMGALKTINRCLPIIILEVLPGSTLLGSDWFTLNILNLGYKKLYDLHGNSVFSCNSNDYIGELN